MIKPKQSQKSITKIYHKQYAATINVGYTDHLKKTLNGILKKKLGRKPNMSNRFYPTKTPVTAVMINIGKSEIPTSITQNTENIMSISFASRIKNYLDNECIRIGKKTIQHVTVESKHGFLGFTNFKFKKNWKKFVVLVQQKKNINTQINFETIKKQKITPQTIHMPVYKNAIANGLRTI